MRLVLMAAMAPLMLASFPTRAAPSFDCSRPASLDQELVCASPEIRALDRELERAAHSRRWITPDIEDQQRRWASTLGAECGLNPRPDTLDRNAATACLYRAYEDRLTLVQSSDPLRMPPKPTEPPFLPHLTVNKDERVCKAVEAAVVEGFRSINPYYSAIDRPWPGLDVEWVASKRAFEASAANWVLIREVTLRPGGERAALALARTADSWRSDRYPLILFRSAEAAQAWADQKNFYTTPAGARMLAEGFEGMRTPQLGGIPGVALVAGRHFLVEDVSSFERAHDVRVAEISEHGGLETICVVKRAPGEVEAWQGRAGSAFAALYERLNMIAAPGAYFGSAATDHFIAAGAGATRWPALALGRHPAPRPTRSATNGHGWRRGVTSAFGTGRPMSGF